jgi:hypothetical protein
MKGFVCDACGKAVSQAIRIDADLEHIGSNIEAWSNGCIAGDYCQDCANKIILFMYGLKGKSDSTSAKLFRGVMMRES